MEPISMGIMGATALATLLSSIFGKKPEETKQYPTLSPNQIGAQDEMLKYVLSGLKNGPGAGFDFAPIRTSAEEQFHQRTIPTIAERFAGADALRGSGFTKSLGDASRGLSTDLASQEAQYKSQTNRDFMNNILSMMQLGLQPRFTTVRSPEGSNAFGSAMNSMIPLLGQVGGMYEKEAQNKQFMDLMKTLYAQQQQPSSSSGPDYFSNSWNDTYRNTMRRKFGPTSFGVDLSGSPYMD